MGRSPMKWLLALIVTSASVLLLVFSGLEWSDSSATTLTEFFGSFATAGVTVVVFVVATVIAVFDAQRELERRNKQPEHLRAQTGEVVAKVLERDTRLLLRCDVVFLVVAVLVLLFA